MIDIKKKIRDYGWTLEKVGNELGVTKSTMTQYVGGNPTLSKLQAIAGVLGIHVSELLCEDDEHHSVGITCPHCGKAIRIELKGVDE